MCIFVYLFVATLLALGISVGALLRLRARYSLLTQHAAEYASGCLAIYHMPNITINDAKAMAIDAMKAAQEILK